MPTVTIDGVTYPSVTEILTDVGLGWPRWLPRHDRAAALGTAVHKAIAMEFAGTLIEESVHPDVRPGVEAFRAFRDTVKLQPRAIEVQVLSREWGVVGHPDFVGHLNGASPLSIIDWKFTDSVDIATTALQVAGYQMLWNYSQADRVTQLFVCQLRKNGTYNLIDLTNEAAIEVFKGAVIVWGALKRMGRIGRDV